MLNSLLIAWPTIKSINAQTQWKVSLALRYRNEIILFMSFPIKVYLSDKAVIQVFASAMRKTLHRPVIIREF